MVNKKQRNIFSFFLLVSICVSSAIAQDIPVSGKVSYNIQKYSGFNWVVDNVTEIIAGLVFKSKTKAKKVKVDIDIFSGLDLIQKKTRSVKVYAKDLLIKKVPIEHFELQTSEPVYFTKSGRKYRVKFPLDLSIEFVLNPSNLFFAISDTKQEKQDKLNNSLEIDLPLPPLGSTKILIKDIVLRISKNGRIYSELKAFSKINPEAEPLFILVEGDLVIKDKKLLLENLKSEIDGIFTKDSDVSTSFCQTLGDLLNPLINFNKYEKEGIKISKVEYMIEQEELNFNLGVSLFPK